MQIETNKAADPEWMKFFDGDDRNYELKTGACATCNEPIIQWHRHSSAGYTHTATGSFCCDKKFWTMPQAQPK